MTHILYSIHYNNIGFQVLSQVSFLLPGLPWVRPTSFCPFSTLLFRPIVLWSWNWPFNTLNLHWKNEMDLWETLNVDKSTMKGGREDVDAPFWSWDTGLSRTCWPKWQRENLSTWRITFSERNICSGGFRRSQRRPQVVQCISFTKQFWFLMYLVVIQSHPTFSEIYGNIL